MRAAYHCIKTKKKLVQCSVTTQMERTPDGHKPASQLNTTRKINSHMNYSHPAQPKQLALSVALSQCSIPRRESSCSCSSTSETCPAMRPHGAAEVRERNSPPLAPPKPPRAEARQPHRPSLCRLDGRERVRLCRQGRGQLNGDEAACQQEAAEYSS